MKRRAVSARWAAAAGSAHTSTFGVPPGCRDDAGVAGVGAYAPPVARSAPGLSPAGSPSCGWPGLGCWI